jgi:hypothetical protein
MCNAIAAIHPLSARDRLLTATATFPLIFMGGLVTSHAEQINEDVFLRSFVLACVPIQAMR